MIKEFAKFFLDIAKYMITAILISTFFSMFESRWPIYLFGAIMVGGSLFTSIVLFKLDERRKIENKEK